MLKGTTNQRYISTINELWISLSKFKLLLSKIISKTVKYEKLGLQKEIVFNRREMVE